MTLPDQRRKHIKPRNTKKEKIRKSRRSKLHRDPISARLAGISLKNNVVYKEKPSGKKWKPRLVEVEDTSKFTGFRHGVKLAPWKDTPQLTKRHAYLHAMLSLKDYTVYTMSLNLSPSTEKAIRRRKKLDYARDIINKCIAEKVPPDIPHLFFICAELSNPRSKDRTTAPLSQRRLHFHGAFALPTNAETERVATAIGEKIAARLARNYRQRYNNKAIRVDSTFARKQVISDMNGNTVEISVAKKVNAGWASYCNKTDGEVLFFGVLDKDLAVSSHLRSLTGEYWRLLRKVAQGFIRK